MSPKVYILLLKSNKFYVGHTTNMMKAMDMHFSGGGQNGQKRMNQFNVFLKPKEIHDFLINWRWL